MTSFCERERIFGRIVYFWLSGIKKGMSEKHTVKSGILQNSGRLRNKTSEQIKHETGRCLYRRHFILVLAMRDPISVFVNQLIG
jgi:hypothetical protein